MKRRRNLVIAALGAVTLVVVLGGATVLTAPDIELSWSTFSGGGGSSSSPSFGVESTVGELTGGEANSESFGVQAGFSSGTSCFDDEDGLDVATEETLGTNPCAYDTDGDGCADGAEVGDNPGLGGLRDPLDFWDTFDTPDPAATPQRDKAVTIADIFRVAGRFGATGDETIDPLSEPPVTGYHPAYDRGDIIGENTWNRAPADGSITVGDIFAVAAQFGHDCS